MNLPAWLHLAKSLDESGDTTRAYAVLGDAAKQGHVRAMVALAQLKWKYGQFYEAGEFMAEAERKVAATDWDSHFAMHLAYATGVAHGDYETKQRLAFEHLLRAARESGDPRMKLSVGMHLWKGLNTVPQDWQAAEQWLAEAAESGVPDIVASYKRFFRAKQKVQRSAP
jgi:TPR repeat protein